ncbi:hypothetical protein EON83_18680 [bacterium]|nr:MAG: hypothetical protein EON83_18680 [bacterium]
MHPPILCLTEVEWREVGEYSTDENIWARNRTCPNEGEIRWCQTHYSEWVELELFQKRWLLFQQGISLINRGIDSREELEALAIIEIEVLGIKEGTPSPAFEKGQWLRVRCLQAIPFAQIPQRLPPICPNTLATLPLISEPAYASEKLFLHEGGGEQVTETTIYAAENGAPTHLISFQISILNECEIYNWPIK